MKHLILGTLALTALVVTGCGKGESLDSQETQREQIGPELQGEWRTTCDGGVVHEVKFAGDQVTFARTDHFDPECDEKQKTIRQTSTFALAHNFKSGVNNSIVVTASNTIQVEYHTDTDVDQQNIALSALQNRSEETVRADADTRSRKRALRSNLALRQTKSLGNWQRSTPKDLTKLQAEVLGVAPFQAFGSRTGIRYEVDNSFLQLSNGHIYHK
jgi:hypothetical protein